MDVYQAPAQRNEPDPNSLRELVHGWERMRLRFNLILLPLGLIDLLLWSYQDWTQLLFLLPGALLFEIGANCCYFLGPLAELYARALLPEVTPRQLFYWAGVVFSLLIILLSGAFGFVFNELVL
ncbi:hypothetical protein [Roseibacillus persicicus]|uniref:hypothetical protein n=1 Tax=Roseibacillus persicicus TaxID=454148 RepID=UPI00280D45F8|nr:hypothetical protein [Roseibacillus persicicus]MDQ8188726.1 hypothetical protein [Roseibacillus persicicus]